MLLDSIKIGRLDEEAQPSAYPRRGVLKAGLLIGAVASVAMKGAWLIHRTRVMSDNPRLFDMDKGDQRCRWRE